VVDAKVRALVRKWMRYGSSREQSGSEYLLEGRRRYKDLGYFDRSKTSADRSLFMISARRISLTNMHIGKLCLFVQNILVTF
jgi:hypothetical protein